VAGSHHSHLPLGLFAWWFGLGAVSLFNIGVLARSWTAHLKKSAEQSQYAYPIQHRLSQIQ
jgi:hypothetical protein